MFDNKQKDQLLIKGDTPQKDTHKNANIFYIFSVNYFIFGAH